jgi:hypothetical protein
MGQCHLTPRYSNSDERIHSVSVDAEKVVQREKIASAQAAVVVFSDSPSRWSSRVLMPPRPLRGTASAVPQMSYELDGLFRACVRTRIYEFSPAEPARSLSNGDG